MNALTVGIMFIAWICPFVADARQARFGELLCLKSGFECREILKGDSWDSLWPEAAQRDLVKRVNRMNIKLRPGMMVAVPQSGKTPEILEWAPLPSQISAPGEKVILVDLDQLAWGAYDIEGNLKNWGAAAGGKSYCPDTKSACRTKMGEYRIGKMGGARCKSKKYPIGRGGAPMPWCMFYHGGYALHGSYDVPGYNASHGCVRIFPEDAKWLNQSFVEQGTRVSLISEGGKKDLSPTPFAIPSGFRAGKIILNRTLAPTGPSLGPTREGPPVQSKVLNAPQALLHY